MRWETLSSPQIDACSRDTLVVVPVAAIEQHSLHLPVMTDTAIANGIVERLDAACDNKLLVLPTFWLGCSRHHMPFAGTLTTTLDHWTACVSDIVESVIHHGFKKVLVLNCHGGNHAVMNTTLERLTYANPDARIVGATYWHIAADGMKAVRESDFGGLGHACEMETSVMLVLHGELVDMTKAKSDRKQPASRFSKAEMQQGSMAVVHRDFRDLTNHGGVGDANLASQEKGEAFLEVIIPALKELVGDIVGDRI